MTTSLIAREARTCEFDRRFPFRSERPEDQAHVRQLMEDTLQGCRATIASMVRVQARLDAFAREEIEADVLVHLWEKSLPAFDCDRHASLAGYLYICIVNKVRNCLAARRTEMRRQPLASPVETAAPQSGPDIEAIARRITDQPEAHLSKPLARLLRAIHESPNVPRGELAKRLGYRQRSSVSRVLRQARQAIVHTFNECD